MAHTVIRDAWCRTFEDLGIAYLVCPLRGVGRELARLDGAFAMVNGSDLAEASDRDVAALRRIKCGIWVDPWFPDSDRFLTGHGLDPEIWRWDDDHRRRVLDADPAFVYTATVPSGLEFFASWEARGVRVLSLPLACDVTRYRDDTEHVPEFEGIELAFVGGYWESKGRQLDAYLRQFEDRLTVFGYAEWPYRGYRGKLDPSLEPALYRQARVSPTINEPSVAILKGQINERIFKVFGSGGTTVVDAVGAYRELFTADELPIPSDPGEFADLVEALLLDDALRAHTAAVGRRAVLDRHTYHHRARTWLAELDLDIR